MLRLRKKCKEIFVTSHFKIRYTDVILSKKAGKYLLRMEALVSVYAGSGESSPWPLPSFMRNLKLPSEAPSYQVNGGMEP